MIVKEKERERLVVVISFWAIEGCAFFTLDELLICCFINSADFDSCLKFYYEILCSANVKILSVRDEVRKLDFIRTHLLLKLHFQSFNCVAIEIRMHRH